MFLALLSFAGFTRRQVDTMGTKAFVKLQRIYTRMHQKIHENNVCVFFSKNPRQELAIRDYFQLYSSYAILQNNLIS